MGVKTSRLTAECDHCIQSKRKLAYDGIIRFSIGHLLNGKSTKAELACVKMKVFPGLER